MMEFLVRLIPRSFVLAQIVNPVVPTLGNEPGASTIGPLLSTIFTAMTVVGVIFSVFNLIMGAYLWISAGGDKAQLQKAQQKILNAIVAMMILFSIWALVYLIGSLFGLNLVEIRLPTFSSVMTGGNGNGNGDGNGSPPTDTCNETCLNSGRLFGSCVTNIAECMYRTSNTGTYLDNIPECNDPTPGCCCVGK